MTNIDWDPIADALSTAHIKCYVPYPDRERTIIPPRVKWWVVVARIVIVAAAIALTVAAWMDGHNWWG